MSYEDITVTVYMTKFFFTCAVLEELIFYLVSYVKNDNVLSGEFNLICEM